MKAYQIVAEIAGFRPRTWRRFQIAEDMTVAEMAYVLMSMFRMEGSHLFCINTSKASHAANTHCQTSISIRFKNFSLPQRYDFIFYKLSICLVFPRLHFCISPKQVVPSCQQSNRLTAVIHLCHGCGTGVSRLCNTCSTAVRRLLYADVCRKTCWQMDDFPPTGSCMLPEGWADGAFFLPLHFIIIKRNRNQ